MLLTILTPSMRHHQLQWVQESIKQALAHTRGVLTVRHLVQYNPPDRLPYGDHIDRWNDVMTSVQSGWICWLSDDNLMHPKFLARLEDGFEQFPDARAFVFAQERHDHIGNLSATPHAIRPYHIDGGQVVLHTSIIDNHRWSARTTGDAEFIGELFEQYPHEFVFIDDLLTYHDRLTWPDMRIGGRPIHRMLMVVLVYHRYEQARHSRNHMRLPCDVDWLEIENDPNEPPGYAAILRKYQQARDYLLQGQYDAMCCIEDDMIVPPNALERMVLVDSDIVYTMYNSRHRPHHCNIFLDIHESGGRSITQYDAVRYNDTVIGCVGVGQGCTVLSRSVLSAIQFRLHPEYASYAPDWWFAMDAKAHGFRQHAHLGIKCGHMISDHEAVYPDVTSPYLFRLVQV